MRTVELAMDLERWSRGEIWIGFMAHEDFVWSFGYFLLTDEDASHKYMKGKTSTVALLRIEIMNTSGKYRGRRIKEQKILGTPTPYGPYDLSIRYSLSYAEENADVREYTIGGRTALEITNATIRVSRKEVFYSGSIVKPEPGFGLMV
ncbi:MAG: hypothetical protein RXR06_07920 [Thermoproteus sp.]